MKNFVGICARYPERVHEKTEVAMDVLHVEKRQKHCNCVINKFLENLKYSPKYYVRNWNSVFLGAVSRMPSVKVYILVFWDQDLIYRHTRKFSFSIFFNCLVLKNTIGFLTLLAL